jgi:malate dehydrogenase (oxaloacetate-decarboxylating)
MADGTIVFALANPDPEIDPGLARRHAAVVATGRSDQPNQNQTKCWPSRAPSAGFSTAGRDLSRAAQRVAACAIAGKVPDGQRDAQHLVPDVCDENLVPAVARAVMNA